MKYNTKYSFNASIVHHDMHPKLIHSRMDPCIHSFTHSPTPTPPPPHTLHTGSTPNKSPCSDTRVELLKLPDAHNVIMVFVEGVEHGPSLFLRQVKLFHQHVLCGFPRQAPHIVVNIFVENLLDFFTE